MLERSRICGITTKGLARALSCVLLGLAGCAATDEERPAPAVAMPAVAKAAAQKPAADPRASAAEAGALLAQAETDIQRARSRRALWAKAWESLVGARAAHAAQDYAGSIRLAKHASELAQLGLEQLAYPAVSLKGNPP
jgi:hypothetical protein